ncbi:MAG TPA: type IX secretion system membrane protein PorP/SprF [Daejeonella sp.]|nr:type IX secretion system membrane protein PorP/SprF [Daejeonella sp.]
MAKSIYIFLFFCLMAITASAQQDAQYSQYMFNSLVINPAYAGYKESLNLSLLHRNQWVGLQGAPKTQSFIIDDAFSKKQTVGLGLSVVNEKIGLHSQTSAYANYAYRLPVGANDERLSFGLALGAVQYVLNSDQVLVEDPSDPTIGTGKQSYFSPEARFGVFFNTDQFYAGFSISNLLSPFIDPHKIGQNPFFAPGRHYFLTSGFLADINDDIKIKPSFMIKEDTKGPTNIDLNTFFLFHETVWLGASYRTGLNWKKTDVGKGLRKNSVVGAVELFAAKKFRLGYAYDYSLSGLAAQTSGTHEISLGMVIGKRNPIILNPRYF